MKNPFTLLRLAGIAEAVSFLLLVGICVPLKYWGGQPLGVRIVGPIHGIFFLTFCWALYDAVSNAGLARGRACLLFLSAFFPFGPFFFEKQLRTDEAAHAARELSSDPV